MSVVFKFMFLIWGLFCFSVFAQDLVRLEYSESSELTDANLAKAEIWRKVVDHVSFDEIARLMTEKEVKAKKSILQKKILSQYTRYIPSYKLVKAETVGNLTTHTYSLQFSRSDIQNLLIQEALLSQDSSSYKILPMISFLDLNQSKTLKWWMPSNNSFDPWLAEQASRSFQILSENMWLRSFMLLNVDRHDFVSGISEKNKKETYTSEEMQNLARQFKAELYARGVFRFGPGKSSPQNLLVKLSLSIHSTNNSKILAELHNEIEIDSAESSAKSQSMQSFFQENFALLATQLESTMNRGGLSSNSLKLALVGNINPQDLEKFKMELMKNNPNIRSLKARKFESGRFVFELDYNGNPEQMAGAGGKISLLNRMFEFSKSEQNTIELKQVKQ